MTFIEVSKGSMIKMTKNIVTVSLRSKEAKKSSKSCSGPQFQHDGRRAFPTPPSNSQTPAGCPIIQLNSDAVYLEIALDSTN